MLDRRQFLAAAAGGVLSIASGGGSIAKMTEPGLKARVSVVRTSDRASGIGSALSALGVNPVKGKGVLIKPNFNTADPFPASTHNDTLVHLIGELRGMGARDIAIGERSGPPDTGEVLEEKGIYALAREQGVGLVNFEELPKEDWVHMKPPSSHWRDGFYVARPVLEAECVVSTCCLKTHRYGGVFTMSLKLSVGITHKRNMSELHASFRAMRKMIAEVNAVYSPSLILMDGIEVFTDGGPMSGTRERADVIVAGTDRVAVDAVGLAVLKDLGSNRAIMETPIFGQEQIARAVELGLGVSRPADIELLAPDEKSGAYAARLKTILEREG